MADTLPVSLHSQGRRHLVGLGLSIGIIAMAPTALDAGVSPDETAEPIGLTEPTELQEGEQDEQAGEKKKWSGFWVGPLRIGGALRVNYIYKDWDEAYDWPGELAFDTARLNLDLNANRLGGSFEYRYYRDRFADGHDYGVLHHAWLGWKFDEHHAIQVGVMKAPFGILPFASHNWFFQLPYYVGFEDDYDLGIKYIGDYRPLNLQAAYYLRSERNGIGESDDSARYSYDLVREGTEGNAERDQFNLRVAHALRHGPRLVTELGLSAMVGRVENRNPLGGTGDRYALALHLNGNYYRWNLMLQTIRYEFDVVNDPNLDASPDGSFVTKGAYDAAYHVASEATIYTGGVAYTLPIGWKSIQSLTFYNDFSLMAKDRDGFRDSLQNVTGCSVATGENQPWLGGDWTDGLASGGEPTGRNTRFNVNVGVYF